MREFVPDPSPTWAKDIRWQNVYARVRPYKQTPDELIRNRRANVTEVLVEVRWSGDVFVAKYYLLKDDVEDGGVWLLLDEAIRSLDRMLEEHGHLPYTIRSTDEQEEIQEASDTPA